MMQSVKDTAGIGILLWLIGYLASLGLFFSPLHGIMGWILLGICTPVSVIITWWWFRKRDLSLYYYTFVGITWTVIAVIFDYLFIVLFFNATYYGADVYLYYLVTFLIPVIVGFYLIRARKRPAV